MKEYKADLHTHTVLSPCGDLDMSPVKIVDAAVKNGIEILGISDHNSTRSCAIVKKIAYEHGIFVLQGAEVTTREEVHCLAFFENDELLSVFQDFLDANLPDIKNDPVKFGYQVQVDENEMIVYEEDKLLMGAINKSIEEIEGFVHSLGGIFIPAHIDRAKNSIFSQLGFFPEGLNADALEVSKRTRIPEFRKTHPELDEYTMITNSDAHFLEDVGTYYTYYLMEKISFQEIRMALSGIMGRKVILK